MTQSFETAPMPTEKPDTFSIYQIKSGAPKGLAFSSLEELNEQGLIVNPNHYEKVYTGFFTPSMDLDGIFDVFNRNHPKDFKGHSLSVSDIIVLCQNETSTAYYTDFTGFADVSEDFLPNPTL